MMMIKRYIFSLLSLLILYGCDKIENPYKDGTVNNDTTIVTDRTRRILIEDYTGHTCGNCPAAAKTAQQIKDTYGDQIIVMGVHAGWFAKPKTGNQYTIDFRNAASEEYDVTFGNSVAGNPNGLINRITKDGSIIIQPSNWETAVLDIKDLEAALGMKINSEYNETSNSISITVDTDFYSDLSNDNYIVVSFVEDSIIAWQKDYTVDPNDIENYVHRHVFRGNVNGIWGDAVDPTITTEGTQHTFNYSFTPDTSWNINHSYLVTYLYNASNYEILQVAETKVIE